MVIQVALACATAEAAASVATSASCKDCAEDVRVPAIIVAELKFLQVERQIGLTHVVVCTDDSAFEQTPERFQIIRMDLAAYIFVRLVVNVFMRERLVEFLVASSPPVTTKLNIRRYRLGYEPRRGFGRSIFDHFADHVAFTSHCADDRRLPLRAATVLLLVPVAIAVQPATLVSSISTLPLSRNISPRIAARTCALQRVSTFSLI